MNEVALRRKAHFERLMAAAREGRAHTFAVEWVRGYIEEGWSLDSLLGTNGGGGGSDGYSYSCKHGRFAVSEIGHAPCAEVFSLKALYGEAQGALAAKPVQADLWVEMAVAR